MPKLSIQNSLQWICRRCLKAEFAKPEVTMVIAKDTELLKVCSLCGVENWCFPVTSGRPVKGAKSDTNTTDMAPEAELAEENEAIEEAVTAPLGEILDIITEEEKEPEETPVEAVTEDTNDVQVEETPEEATSEETEASTEAEGEQPEAPEHDKVADTVRPTRPTEEPLEAEPKPSTNDAEIAELEAKLAKLKPTK